MFFTESVGEVGKGVQHGGSIFNKSPFDRCHVNDRPNRTQIYSDPGPADNYNISFNPTGEVIRNVS